MSARRKQKAPSPPPAAVTGFSAERLILPALLLLSTAIRLLVAFRPFPIVDSLLLPDDAYISLSLARNIAWGHGPLAGLQFTNGFQPLYVFLMVPAFWIWTGDPTAPVQAALVLLIAFDTATLWILFRWIQRLTGSSWIAMAVGLGWAVNPYAIQMTLGGLETAISVCFLTASFSVFDRLMRGSDGQTWRPQERLLTLLGVLVGFAIFARIDNVVLAFILVLILGVRLVRSKTAAAAMGRAIGLRVAGPVVLVNLPWWIYSLYYTGDLYPVSGSAVRFQSLAKVDHEPTWNNFFWPILQRAFRAIYTNNQEILIAAGLLILLALLRGSKGEDKDLQASATKGTAGVSGWTLAALAGYAVALTGAYGLYVYGEWYFARYLYPLLIPCLVALALSLHRASIAVNRLWSVAPRWTAIIAAVGLVAMLSSETATRRLFLYSKSDDGYMNIGLWAREHFKPGTRIGSTQTGALSYFAPELTVINLDGVVNRECFEALRQLRGMEYVRRVGIKYVVNWVEHTKFFLTQSRALGATTADLPLFRTVEGFHSWHQTWMVFKVRYDR